MSGVWLSAAFESEEENFQYTFHTLADSTARNNSRLF